MGDGEGRWVGLGRGDPPILHLGGIQISDERGRMSFEGGLRREGL